MMRRNNPLSFFKRCGDQYVRTITRGGQFDALLEIRTTGSEKREDFKLSISGSYGSANAAATIANSIRSATQNRDVRIIVIRNGGQGPLEGVDPETLIKLALDFPETVAKQPVPVEAETDSYDSLDGGASSLLPAQRAFVRKLFADYRNMLDYAGDLAFVKSHTADFLQLKDPKGSRIDWSNFVDLDHNALEDAARQARSHLQQLEAAAADCVSTKNACSEQLVPASNVPLMRFVRTFEWEAPVKGESLKKPIYIVLPAANYCKLRTMTGFWKVGGPGPFDVPCANLPRGLDQASNVLSGGFDNFYPDNDGDCTYVFTCVRR